MTAKTPVEWMIEDGVSAEQHYTVKEIAELWKLSETMVRELFQNEPGVFKFARPGTRTKRAYTTLRVARSVLDRVHRRMMCRPA